MFLYQQCGWFQGLSHNFYTPQTPFKTCYFAEILDSPYKLCWPKYKFQHLIKACKKHALRLQLIAWHTLNICNSSSTNFQPSMRNKNTLLKLKKNLQIYDAWIIINSVIVYLLSRCFKLVWFLVEYTGKYMKFMEKSIPDILHLWVKWVLEWLEGE